MINDNKITINTKEYGHDGLMKIGAKIFILKNGKYSISTYLTVVQMQTLLSIGFKFNKGIEDIIYKREICEAFNIDIALNQEIIDRISKLELISKIKCLIKEKNMPILDSNGKLVDIFTMSSRDIEEKYGISLETIIDTYGKGETRK